MDLSYWHKQSADKPLFGDLLWSRPENRQLAGKLLIIGGNAQAFAAVGKAYDAAMKAGIGSTRVLLPDSLAKKVGLLPNTDFAPSTPSGSFAQNAVGEALSFGQWADGVLLAGDFGRNSETAIFLERFLSKYNGQVTLTKDALDYFTKTPQQIIDRADTLLVGSLSQLQKLALHLPQTQLIQFRMGILQLVDILRRITLTYPIAIVTRHENQYIVAQSGQISTTPADSSKVVWRVDTAAALSTWWLQNPSKPFESLTSAVLTAD